MGRCNWRDMPNANPLRSATTCSGTIMGDKNYPPNNIKQQDKNKWH